jgi:hypothetical protein
MDPIRVLMTEHRFIERFLDAARGCAARLADPAGSAPPRIDLARIAAFIRAYAAFDAAKEAAGEPERLRTLGEELIRAYGGARA